MPRPASGADGEAAGRCSRAEHGDEQILRRRPSYTTLGGVISHVC